MQGSSVLIAPPPNTFGTEGRNMFRGPSYANWDFSVFKNTKIKERLTAQFRAEFYNILQSPEPFHRQRHHIRQQREGQYVCPA